MKLRTNLILLFVAALTFCSCDEIDKLTEIETSQEFEATLDVNVAVDKEAKPQAKTSAATDWSTSTSIDLKDNSDVKANLDLVESVNLTDLQYQIVDYTGAETAAISNTTIDFGGTVITIADTTLKTAADAGTWFTVENAAQLNAIAAKLKADLEMTITASGTVSDTPVDFGIKLKINTLIVIDVI